MICWLKSRSGLTKTKTIRKWSWFHLHWESAYVHGTCWRAECPVWWYSRNQILDPGTCSGMLGHLSRFDVEHHCEIFRHRRSLLEVFFPHYWEFFSLRSGINKTLETHLCRKTYVREARLYLDSSRKLSAHSTSLYLRKLFLFAPHGQEGAIISAPLLTTELRSPSVWNRPVSLTSISSNGRWGKVQLYLRNLVLHRLCHFQRPHVTVP